MRRGDGHHAPRGRRLARSLAARAEPVTGRPGARDPSRLYRRGRRHRRDQHVRRQPPATGSPRARRAHVDINRAGVRLAREAREQASPASDCWWRARSARPRRPGSATAGRERAARRFSRADRGALEGGIDLLLFETFGSLAEMVEAVSVASELGGAPIVCADDVRRGRPNAGRRQPRGGRHDARSAGRRGDRRELHARAARLARRAWRAGALDDAAAHGATQRRAADADRRALPVHARIPAYFARHAQRFVQLGATIVGGCCGTTPTHIEAVAVAVNGLPPAPRQRAVDRASAATVERARTRPTARSWRRVASLLETANAASSCWRASCRRPSAATPS